MIELKFVIISKKENFNLDEINTQQLESCFAPSLISKDVINIDLPNFLVYIYPYNHITDEKENLYYKISDDDISFFNGSVSMENSDSNSIEALFEYIENNELIIGDYQIVKLDNQGNGFIKTPQASIYPLFYHENENYCVISNELKLVVDSSKDFNTAFVNLFDMDYIEDVVHNGFFYKENKPHYRKTIFKDISRILPQDDVEIKEGQIKITKNSDITIPKWFEEQYFENRDELYDWYYDKLISYSDSLIRNISDDVDKIGLGVTGGFDSRLTVLILSKLCPKYGIELSTHTNGLPEHPDVVLAEKVCSELNVNWKNNSYPKQLRPSGQDFRDYAFIFWISQGDFDSYDFIINYSRKIPARRYFKQSGMDIYKRDHISSLINFNRWYSRRVLFRSNFYFPLLATNLELWFSRIFDTYYHDQNQYKEFVYNVLKRGNPELLKIPFAFNFLPQTDVEEYNVVSGAVSTEHKTKPFLWDYDFVSTELYPILKKYFDENDEKHNHILSKNDVTPLDYFLLQKDIDKILEKNDDVEKITKKIKKIIDDPFYPKYRTYISLDSKKNFYRKRALTKLMDYASVANFKSFSEIEDYFNSRGEYDAKESIYKKKCDNTEKLKKENQCLKKENNNLKKENEKLIKENEEIKNSNSWKLTEPLRKMRRRGN